MENTLENILINLYALQRVDSQLQELDDLKGDLPGIVAELTARAESTQNKIKELNSMIKTAKMDRDSADSEIIGLLEKVEKYKSQQLQVKSNKQYDALTKEIELAEEKSSRLEKEMETLEGKMTIGKTDGESLTAQLAEINAELDDRKKELREITKEHEHEESKFKRERTKLVAKIEKSELERYDRIRRAKGGKAVVNVKRDACGGCFSRIPPQRILELRQNSRLHMCENCGRILVSDQIVTMSPVTS